MNNILVFVWLTLVILVPTGIAWLPLIRKSKRYLWLWIPVVWNLMLWLCLGAGILVRFRLLIATGAGNVPGCSDGLVVVFLLLMVVLFGAPLPLLIMFLCFPPVKESWHLKMCVGPSCVAFLITVLLLVTIVLIIPRLVSF